MLPISKQKFQSTAATPAELAPRVAGKRRRSNLRRTRIFWIIRTAQLAHSSGRVTSAATGRNKRSTLTMTKRDKVRDTPSLGKQQLLEREAAPFYLMAII
ncbi:hypothetical protein CEXT_499741 [Caerostris extrusa]|uniref:Uncharacterized protein n=1 Tax=Caerostris extrusa TaxID=172846 RepID=A0AAV4MZ81_CAEEX|nr:hypothetical protein CEXT_499741 [Caerostris extrusa]